MSEAPTSGGHKTVKLEEISLETAWRDEDSGRLQDLWAGISSRVDIWKTKRTTASDDNNNNTNNNNHNRNPFLPPPTKYNNNNNNNNYYYYYYYC